MEVRDGKREQLQYGMVAPIFWKEKGVLGNYDIAEHKATFAIGDHYFEVTDSYTLGNMLVLTRNMSGGPPGCSCEKCSENEEHASQRPLRVNDWGDFCCGNSWPVDKPIMKALNRPMNTPNGPQDHYVALWYRHGRPQMGRAWNDNGKINASFVDSGREFTGRIIGSMQMLVEIPATAAGFEYIWLPYEQAVRYEDKDFAPVHMNYVAPCVVKTDNFELL
ncbi:unnamed protein product, partial [Cylicostephanus goldi]